MPASAQVAVTNSSQIAMLNTVLLHVSVASTGTVSEVFCLGNINPGGTANASPAFGSGFMPGGGTGTDYWTLLFANFSEAAPWAAVIGIPPTVSNITSNTNNQTIIFNVETDGECTINNPTYKDTSVTLAALGSSTDYAFLSGGKFQPAKAA